MRELDEAVLLRGFEDAGFRGAVKVAQVEGGGQHSMIIAEVQGAAAGAANH